MASDNWGSWGDWGKSFGEESKPSAKKKTVKETIEAVEKLTKPREQRYVDEDARKNRWRDACDSEFWVAIYFTSRAQKEAFLRESQIDDLGDKYIDGRELAKRGEIELPADPPPVASARRGHRWDRFVR